MISVASAGRVEAGGQVALRFPISNVSYIVQLLTKLRFIRNIDALYHQLKEVYCRINVNIKY